MTKLPIHPIFVHYPIAFYLLEFVWLFIWVVKKDVFYRRVALLTFKAAFLAMLVTLGTGWFEVSGFKGIQGHVKPHFYSAVCLLIISISRAFLWKACKDETRWKALLLTSVIGMAIVTLTAYFGGVMVYDADLS